jgi:hypothetical protein
MATSGMRPAAGATGVTDEQFRAHPVDAAPIKRIIGPSAEMARSSRFPPRPCAGQTHIIAGGQTMD